MSRLLPFLSALLSACLLSSCWQTDDIIPESPGHAYDRVTVLCALGYNNLNSYIRDNIRALEKGPLPEPGSRKALLVLAHLSRTNSDWNTPTGIHLVSLSRDDWGHAVRDTLVTFYDDGFLTDPAVLRQGLAYVKEHFESAHYGLILSSHGTGWLPEGYYDSGSSTPYQWSSPEKQRHLYRPSQQSADRPPVKSFGCEARMEGSSAVSHEMTLAQLHDAIPMHLDFILFDACLMGGVEVAWDLRGITDKICFSPAEVIAAGFPYDTFAEQMLVRAPASLTGFAEDFYTHYDTKSGSWRTATVSVVDCGKLDPLAEVCTELFERYRAQIAAVDPNRVQGYFTGNHPWFYDLKDILEQAGASTEDLSRLQEALDRCLLYTAHTPNVLGETKLLRCCGLSMYLPCNGEDELSAFYANLAWNQRTLLVK